MFSPDGKWLAYISNESGRNEIYVRPFPGPGGKWQVSTGGGDDPTWSRKRPELFFATQELRMMVAPYSSEGGSFRVDKPKLLSEGRLIARPRAPSRDLDLHPDGERFVVAPGTDQAASKQDKVVFIFNFFDDLRRVAPLAKR
jgi:serine/threonine-protein kinase